MKFEGNGPGHNTGLTSLHQITTWVIKLRFSRYPCLINCVIKLRFSRYQGLKGIITIIDPCIQMLWHSRFYWRNTRLLDRIGSTDFNIFRCHSDSDKCVIKKLVFISINSSRPPSVPKLLTIMTLDTPRKLFVKCRNLSVSKYWLTDSIALASYSYLWISDHTVINMS